MIEPEAFLDPVREAGFDFFTGVPCSFLTPLINGAISDARTRYVAAASEGEALGIASGAWLAGRETVVMCQNSGLGNAVNPLTSLNFPFRIPTLLVVTWRGGPGIHDEPQHELMGAITPDLLELMGIAHRPFPRESAEIAPAIEAARASMSASSLPFALILEKGSVRGEELDPAPEETPAPGRATDLRRLASPPSRAATLGRLLATVPEQAAIIATTGKCGRELFTLADRPQHLYQVGSMGCAAAMGLGVALSTSRPVIVLDGDGAALMKLGTFATIGGYRPENLVHIVLDNGVHDSTGGQPTVSANVDFARVATACGYRQGFSCDDLDGVVESVQRALGSAGPNFLHVRISPGSMSNLGRPTLAPSDVARRFRAFLLGGTRSPTGPQAQSEAG